MIRIYYLLFFTILSVEMGAQCYPDRHNTTIDDSWVSCALKTSPNVARPNSHWILYEFDSPKEINGIQLWNSNLPAFADIAIRSIAIDYSMDGQTWTDLGTHALVQPAGSSIYEGENIDGLEAFSARYILLTALDTYGSQCAGLAEVKFSLSDATTSIAEESDQWEVTLYPNPTADLVQIDMISDDFGMNRVEVINLSGQIILSQATTENSFSIHVGGVTDGAYLVKLIGKESVAVRKLWIINP